MNKDNGYCTGSRILRLIALSLLCSTGSLTAADDAVVFENHCASCHGNDGRAKTPQGRKVKARDLRESRLTDEEIERKVREGSFSKAGTRVMPAFGNELTAPEIQAVLRTVKSFRASTPTAEK